jgi:hypothetical protein
MIKQSKMTLEFGTGSIRCFFGGWKNRGALLLKQEVPTKIGSATNCQIEGNATWTNIEDFPLVMFFSNTESVDAVINSLKVVRDIVEGKHEASGFKPRDLIPQKHSAR